MQLKQNKQITPLPFKFYYFPLIILSFAGLFDSIYLAISHYRVHADPGYSSFCAISRAINCDTVSSSPYAVFLNIPVAVWGSIGYAIILFVLTLAGSRAANKERFWPLLFWISLLFCIFSLILAGVSTFLINSYCIMCIFTYMVNFALLYYSWFVNKRFGNAGLFNGLVFDLNFLWSIKKITIPVASGFLILTAGLSVTIPEYWQMAPPSQNQSVPRGITEDGHPWIGAQNPEIIIEEFTDYLCTQCRIKHFYLRRLISENPDKIRVIHRHFPMDHKFNPLVAEPYHLGSGILAIFSIYAQAQDKFWEANDLFFQMNKSLGAISSRKIAEELDLSPDQLVAAQYDRHILYKLQKDLEKGLELGLTGTPGYVINGEVFQGHIPPRLLKRILE